MLKKLSISLLLLFIVYVVVQGVTKSKHPKRIACQEKVTCFEKLYVDHNQTVLLHKALEQRNYTLQAHSQASVHMPTQLFSHISLNALSTLLQEEIIERFPKPLESITTTPTLAINYTIHENDKYDPHKLNEKSKNYAGYIVAEFSIGEKVIYKIQIDFVDSKGADIKARLSCIVESVATL